MEYKSFFRCVFHVLLFESAQEVLLLELLAFPVGIELLEPAADLDELLLDGHGILTLLEGIGAAEIFLDFFFSVFEPLDLILEE